MSSGSYLETAPSALSEEQGSVARTIGLTGLMAVVLGALILILNAAKVRLGVEIGNNVGFAGILVGMAMLFYHAARETDQTIRRLYGYVGGIGLPVAGIILSLLPVIISAVRSGPEDGGPKPIISLFFPFGWACFLAGLFFLIWFCRNETEEKHHRYGLMALGGIGAGLALVGFIGGVIVGSFALTYGSVMALLGLGYLVAFVSQLGGADLAGYRPALAIGALGLLVFLVALGRSIFPGDRPFFVPAGLVLMTLGLAYALSAVFLVSDLKIVVLIRRELLAYFCSPIAYILLFISALVAAYNYNIFVAILSMSRVPVPEPIVLYFYYSLFSVFMIVFQVPALTMRLLAEEKRTGTYEVLMCAPVSEVPVVLSKLFAALIFYMLIWAVWLVFLLDIRIESGKVFEYRPLISFYLTLAVTGAPLVAMGLFFSSLTRNQIVAAALTFVVMVAFIAVLLITRDLPQDSPRAVILNHLSFIQLWEEALRGRLHLRDMIIQVSIAAFFAFLTVRVLEARLAMQGSPTMSTTETPAPSFLNALVANRRQVAIGLAAAGVILAALSIWWGVWGFARSDTAPAKADGKLLPEEVEKPAAPAEVNRPKKSPDWQIGAVWAGSVALLCLLCAGWLYSQPPDPVAPLATARVEALTFGGTVGLLTALCGMFLGYRWYQSLVMWVGGGDRREAKWVLYAAAVFVVGLLIMFVSLQLARSEQRTNATLRRILYGFNSVFVGLLLLLVLIAANVVSFLRIPSTLVTNDTAFTALADESKRFLRSLDRPVHVYLIMPEGYSVQYGPRGETYDNLYADARGLLSQCEDESPNFHWTYLSPAFDKERIAALMERLRVKESDRDQLGMLVTVGENEEAQSFIRAIELIDEDQSGRGLVFQGENRLLTELMYLTDARAREKVYFTQDQGELSIEPGADRQKSANGVVQFLRDRKMLVEPLQFPVGQPGRVPDDAAVVVIAGLRKTLPADDPMIAALKEYMSRPGKKGKLFVCLPAFRDPTGKVAPTGLESFMAGFGVEVDPGRRIITAPGQLRGARPEFTLAAPFEGVPPELERAVGRNVLVLRDARPVRPMPGGPGQAFRASPLFGTTHLRGPLITWLEGDFLKAPDTTWDEIQNDRTGELARQKEATRRAVPVAVAVTESVLAGGKGSPRPQILVFGSETFLQDEVGAPASAAELRQQFVSDTIDWLRERGSSIGIPPRKLGMFALERPVEWPTQVILLVMVTISITAVGVGVWLSRRR